MNAVTAALARGEITPGEAERIAGVVDTFVRAIKTTKKEGSGLNLLQILTAGNYDDDDNAENNSEAAIMTKLVKMIMMKPAIMKKPMIALRSKRGHRAGDLGTADTGRRAESCFNLDERSCCRFFAGAAIGNN
jgi:hypothetical protein